MMFDPKAQWDLANLFKARFPYVYIPTWEEKRAEEFILSTAWDERLIIHPREVYSWTQTAGFTNLSEMNRVNGTQDPMKAFAFIESCDRDAIFIMKDLHVFFGVQGRPPAYDLIRRMRDLIPVLHESQERKNIVILSPQLVIPADMERKSRSLNSHCQTLTKCWICSTVSSAKTVWTTAGFLTRTRKSSRNPR